LQVHSACIDATDLDWCKVFALANAVHDVTIFDASAGVSKGLNRFDACIDTGEASAYTLPPSAFKMGDGYVRHCEQLEAHACRDLCP
jgi:hypothetical protein